MATDRSDRIRQIAEARELPEAEVRERALERGLDDLWTEVVLTRYFEDEIDRAEAIDALGQSIVERAERERAAVEDDVEWGLNA